MARGNKEIGLAKTKQKWNNIVQINVILVNNIAPIPTSLKNHFVDTIDMYLIIVGFTIIFTIHVTVEFSSIYMLFLYFTLRGFNFSLSNILCVFFIHMYVCMMGFTLIVFMNIIHIWVGFSKLYFPPRVLLCYS